MVDVYFRPAFVERGGEGEGEEVDGRGNKSGIPPPWKTVGGGRERSGNFEGVSVSLPRSFNLDRIIYIRESTFFPRSSRTLDLFVFSFYIYIYMYIWFRKGLFFKRSKN